MKEEAQIADTRVRLGPLALKIATAKAGNERVTQAHLEEAISDLMERQQDGVSARTRETLQMLNENLIRLRQIILAANTTSDDELSRVLDTLNKDLFAKQVAEAEKNDLDTNRLVSIQSYFERERAALNYDERDEEIDR